MFIYKYSTLISQFSLYSPIHLDVLNEITSYIYSLSGIPLSHIVKKVFLTFPSISIDFAIMEKSKEIICLPVDFGWSDIGTFDTLSLFKTSSNSLLSSNDYISINSPENFIFNQSNLKVYTIDADNLIVVVTEKEVLIIKKGSSNKVKDLIKLVQSSNK
jgi:mannose-1-phosphate guanylyltransferase